MTELLTLIFIEWKWRRKWLVVRTQQQHGSWSRGFYSDGHLHTLLTVFANGTDEVVRASRIKSHDFLNFITYPADQVTAVVILSLGCFIYSMISSHFECCNTGDRTIRILLKHAVKSLKLISVEERKNLLTTLPNWNVLEAAQSE